MKTQDIPVNGYEKVVKCELIPGVDSVIAIHNTKLGPALGGCRMFDYVNFDAALTDALRLSEGMSYKSALAGLNLGGGKSVIMGDPAKIKTREVLTAFGDFIDSLGGRYITAKDVGIGVEDLDVISLRTRHVRGTSKQNSSGDPSPMTAYGVFQGMRASCEFLYGNPSLKGKRVIVQGLGHVGFGLVKHLIEDGAQIIACDIDSSRTEQIAKNYSITAIGVDDWTNVKADIFAPCAMGAVLDESSINALKNNGIKIVAGGANNQLKDMLVDGQHIKDAGIKYAPDYVINAGGIINVASETENAYEQAWALEKTKKIYDITLKILNRAKAENRPTAVVSLEMARELLA